MNKEDVKDLAQSLFSGEPIYHNFLSPRRERVDCNECINFSYTADWEGYDGGSYCEITKYCTDCGKSTEVRLDFTTEESRLKKIFDILSE